MSSIDWTGAPVTPLSQYLRLITAAKPRPQHEAPTVKLTEAEKRAACEEVRAGACRNDVARRLGVHPDSLTKWAAKMGMQREQARRGPETIAEAKRLRERGMSCRAIGEKLGVPKSTVTMWMNKHAD